MVKLVVFLFLAVIAISVLRAVIGVIAKAFGGLLSSGPASRPAQPIGELKRDPVCGTYVDASSSLQTTAGNQTLYFCSEECRRKYLAAHS